MPEIAVEEALPALDAALELAPNQPAVFLLWPKQGEPHLGKTTVLRRRLLRLLRERESPSRMLNLRHTLARVEYWLTGSKLESSVRMYELARQYFPGNYLDVLRLRADQRVIVVDEDEFAEHQVRYGYPADVISEAERAAAWLLDAISAKAEPFGAVYRGWLDMIE